MFMLVGAKSILREIKYKYTSRIIGTNCRVLWNYVGHTIHFISKYKRGAKLLKYEIINEYAKQNDVKYTDFISTAY